MLKTFLTLVHIVINDGGKMVTYTEAWNIAFKTVKPPWKIWKHKSNLLYILNKTNLTAEIKALGAA